MRLSMMQRLFLMGRALSGAWNLKPGSRGMELLKGMFPGAVGTPPLRGVEAQLKGYSAQPWARAIASRVAYSVAAIPWKLYAVKGKATTEKRPWVRRRDIQFCGNPLVRKSLLLESMDEGDVTEITDHPLLELLTDGNPLFSGMAARKVAQVHHDLVGEAFLLKERGALHQPVALWPVPPHWVVSTPTVTHPFFRVSFRGWQGFIPLSEFIWARELDPVFPYGRGTGVAQALSDELETDEYAAKYLKHFFYNEARPDLVIAPKADSQSLSIGEMERLEQAWLSEHRGFWRAFKPLFSSRPLDVTVVDANFRQLQLKDLRLLSRDFVFQTWGVPPEIFGVLENSNRATIDAADYLYNTHTIVPRLEHWRLEYQRQLVSDYDARLVLDYVTPVQEDREFQLNVMKGQPGAYHVDEWRELAGFSELADEEGQRYLKPLTTEIIDSLAGHPQPGDEPAVPVGAPAPGEGFPAAKLAHLSDEELLALAWKEASRASR